MANQPSSTPVIPIIAGRHAYEVSREISSSGAPFYALIMAAMRGADTDNLVLLRTAFPEVWAELQARYSAPGGVLPQESRMTSHEGFTG